MSLTMDNQRMFSSVGDKIHTSMFSSVRVDVVVAMVAYNWEALVWRTNIFGSRKSVRGYIYVCMVWLKLLHASWLMME